VTYYEQHTDINSEGDKLRTGILLANKSRLKTVLFMAVIALYILGCIYWKQELYTPIASQTDTYYVLSKKDMSVTQSYEAVSENICGISMQLSSEASGDLSGDINISLRSKPDGNDIRKAVIPVSNLASRNDYKVFWPKLKTKVGERYYIVFSLNDPSDDTKIALKMNSSYYGLKVNGNAAKGALAITTIGERTSNAAFLMYIFGVFTTLTLLLSIISGRNYEELIPVTLVGIFLWLFTWGIFGKLYYGSLSLVIGSAIASLAVPYIIEKKKIKMEYIISPGAVLFWLLVVICFVFDRNRVIGDVDDLTHWSLAVRDMWFNNSYGFHPGRLLMLPRYTPGMTLIEYLFVWMYGAYRDGVALFACHFVGLSFMEILFSKIEWKQWYKVIPIGITIMIMPLIVFKPHYSVMLVDAYLGIVWAYIFICYIEEGITRFNCVRITTGTIFLTMVKETGTVMAGIMLLIIIIDLIGSHGTRNRRKELWDKQGKMLIISVMSAVCPVIVWEIYVTVMGTLSGANTLVQTLHISSKNIAAAASVAATDDTQNIHSFGNVFRKTIIYFFTGKDFAGTSYINILLIVFLFISILSIMRVYDEQHIPIKKVLNYIIIATMIYFVFMMICYASLFAGNPSTIASARRYYGTALIWTVMVIISLSFYALGKYENSVKVGEMIWIIGLFVIILVPNKRSIYSMDSNKDELNNTWDNQQCIGEVFRSFADKSEKIYVISYKDSKLHSQYNSLVVANAVAPNATQGASAVCKPVVRDEDKKKFGSSYGDYTGVLSADNFSRYLAKEYKYIYLFNINDYFIDNYSGLFANGQKIENGGIYEIRNNNGQVRLYEIAEKNISGEKN
jgi:hypothetical protein